jgi:outer membrane protein assembly factor BamB
MLTVHRVIPENLKDEIMIKSLKYLAIVLMVLSVAACSKKQVAYVAPLIQFDQTLAVNTVWTTSVGGNSQKEYLKLTPTLYNGQIYVANGSGQISIVDQDSGKRVWNTNIKEPISSGVGADGGRIYVGTRKGELIAIGREDGSIAWRAQASNEILTTPNAVNGLVLFKTIDDIVYALNAQNGTVAWSYRQSVPDMILRGGNAPMVAGNSAVVGFADGSVAAFNRHNGNMLWSNMVARPIGISAVEQMVDIDNSMVISDGVVYVASYQGSIAAIDLHSGEIFWEKKTSSYAGLALDAQNIYVSEANGHLWALNRRNGNLVWRQENLTGRGITGPVLIGNVVALADKEGFVHWMTTATGQFVARTRPDPSGIIANPVTDGRSVYVLTRSGRLVKYN